MQRLPIFFGLGTVTLAVALAFAAWGQGEGGDKPPVLHQDLTPPEEGSGRASSDGIGKTVFGPAPTEGQNPSAFANGQKILPKPPGDSKKKGTEPVHGAGGFAADRDTQASPDRQTGPDSTLQYITVFNPSVLPFKRMSTMNTVGPDMVLRTSNSHVREDQIVGGRPNSDRDKFWGNLVIDLKPGVDVPIPSVAPDMRILSYEVEPRTTLTFSKDGSDNFYVRSDESGVSGTYRLVFMADADAGYFAPQVPRRYRVRDLARYAPPEYMVGLPPNVQKTAERALSELRVYPSMRLDVALDKLTFYFRAFEAKPIANPTGDIYWDLFINKAGVCRHRSFAFMITATALGIPTRYVTNEAHAWVEVWVPGSKWMRVDLGGAALRMQVDNAEDKTLHQPRTEDPFAQPPEYENNYTQLEGEIDGLSDEQIAERREGYDGADPDFDPEAPPSDDPDTMVGPGRTLPSPSDSAASNKIPTDVQITGTEAVGYRGETLPVSGVLMAAEPGDVHGIGNQRVNIWVAPLGNDGEGAELLGHTVTEADGSFSLQLTLPDDMQLRDYEIFASTPGDARYAPAVSE